MALHTELPIIGLTGYAGTGKDTVRAMLEQRGFVGLAFADPIRNMLRTLLSDNGISEAWMDERTLKERPMPELGKSYRELVQTLGTEWGRAHLGADFLLRIAEAYLHDTTSQTFGQLPFVVSDVRFQNEADWVRQRGGVIWRVDRPGTASVRAHASEQGATTIKEDALLLNNSTIEDLSILVGHVLHRSQA